MSSKAAMQAGGRLRRVTFAKEIQQMAVTCVQYGSAAYCFRKYVLGVTAVSDFSQFSVQL